MAATYHTTHAAALDLAARARHMALAAKHVGSRAATTAARRESESEDDGAGAVRTGSVASGASATSGENHPVRKALEEVRARIAALSAALKDDAASFAAAKGKEVLAPAVAPGLKDALDPLAPSSAPWAAPMVMQLLLEATLLQRELDTARAILDAPPDNRGKRRSLAETRVAMLAMLEGLVEELDITANVLNARLASLDDEVLLQRGILEERRAVGRALQAQLEGKMALLPEGLGGVLDAAAGGVSLNDDDVAELVQQRELDLAAKERALKGYTSWLGESLKDFVAKAYPPVVRPEVAGYWDSLEDTLAQLLAATMDDSLSSAYIPIESSMYEPYIELLLRAGAIEKHPSDPSRIRLVPFHQ
ncbi:uncharacterized protein AMSG_03489 [Thecamonas trahens ATCC 50062]|uniref:Uncharacterized protein n=1 Tax=Thecamonas trahens ATCC 50062 TaxID=461836 RepID=A0A0L0D4B4_THETB|nr:hypothetical protein AMSG_03489 [Thecamonas trahens ATCC 50062]KNC47065.1 hypothetical protein AMSG_03489 [Thecamonas trahens ATCC 50062]|eukprot:XP_013759845.1 hypothetical protein AMSG_03489 [Thecamonas trahens ATCC 50062]